MSIAQKEQQLHVKSYFAASVQQAMEAARQELGQDALLLNSREAPPEAKHLGEYEVVFGSAAGWKANMAAASGTPGITELCSRMDEIRDLLARFGPGADKGGLERALVEAEVETALAREIEEEVRQRVGRRSVLEIGRLRAPEPPAPALGEEVSAVIDRRLVVDPSIGRVTALIGPPGSGKTTTLVKLAIRHGLMMGRPVRLISTDTQRIGAAEQLKTYAAIMGAPFQAVESTPALAQAIDSAPSETLLLIDTPGYSVTLLRELGRDLAVFLSNRQEIDTHLVLTASTRPADLKRTADLYEGFGYAKLLFTRLDETTSYGAMFCESVRRQRPLSFFGNGQSVPEDLEPVSKRPIIDALVRQLPLTRRAVA